MIKGLTLLLVALIAATVSGQSCVTVFTRPPTSGTASYSSGRYVYTGIVTSPGGGTQDYNNMLYYSLTAAKAATAVPNGRLVGMLSMSTGTGNMAFEFFKTGSWIASFFGKGPTMVGNVVTGGTGCFAGRTGTTSRTIALASPLIFKWDICTQATKSCAAGAA
jgi:hypothetical protein